MPRLRVLAICWLGEESRLSPPAFRTGRASFEASGASIASSVVRRTSYPSSLPACGVAACSVIDRTESREVVTSFLVPVLRSVRVALSAGLI